MLLLIDCSDLRLASSALRIISSFHNAEVYVLSKFVLYRQYRTYNREYEKAHYQLDYTMIELQIDNESAWHIFLSKTKEYFEKGYFFLSPKRGNEYKIVDWSEEGAKIKRLSVESETEVRLTKYIFDKAFNVILSSNGVIPKEKLYNKVAFESALVFFLPMLDWDEHSKNIIINSSVHIQSDSHVYPTEATNDNVDERVLREMRIRRGQNKLRDGLFTIYENKCCITGNGIKEILHACHINPYSQSGDNRFSNALLLRSDIHDLFDSHLLGINPQTLTVHINSKLINTDYNKLEGKKINEGKFEIELNKEALRLRWQLFKNRNVE